MTSTRVVGINLDDLQDTLIDFLSGFKTDKIGIDLLLVNRFYRRTSPTSKRGFQQHDNPVYHWIHDVNDVVNTNLKIILKSVSLGAVTITTIYLCVVVERAAVVIAGLPRLFLVLGDDEKRARR